MTGSVENNEAILPITFRTDTFGDVVAQFVVDTGYTGVLTLPPEHIAALGLKNAGDMVVILADGSETKVDVYDAVIVWHGVEYPVTVLEIDSRPLLGTILMQDSKVTIEFREGGSVTVEPLT